MKRAAASTALAIVTAFSAAHAADPFPPDERTAGGQRQLEVLASFFGGTFTMAPEATGNAPMRLRHIRLWPERTGEHWFYVEYVKPGEEDKPVRQRIFRLGEAGGSVQGVVYDVPDPKLAMEELKKAKPFEGFDPKRLKERTGCRVDLQQQQLTLYAGGTAGKSCPPEAPGPAYETTDYYITSSSLRTWTQGFDAVGKVVWKLSREPLELRRVSSTGQ